ncbi:MAG: hypothetical protein DWB44_15245 [Chloroflexi bacterium]|nr:MAG: hypothetical protein UZ13_02101 [Chloroflexi bacterium OLB13]MBC6957524.1 hypothetical protein [Chloroflexota bacterium]MBW7879017.1 hypothetical protein [Anaerolineae bacterium]MEB2364755.1 hypothetical protein [Chloroflexota bacterium]
MSELAHFVSVYIAVGPASRDVVLADVAAALDAAEGRAYDPFGLMPAPAFTRAVKLLAAPVHNGWLRLASAPDSRLDPVLDATSRHGLTVHAVIDAELVPRITAYRNGSIVDLAGGLPGAFDRARVNALLAVPITGHGSAFGGVSSAALPPDVRAMSSGLGSRQVERLMHTMTAGMGRGNRDSAQSALVTVDWDAGAGRWMRDVLIACGIGDHVLPDYATLSTAYRVFKRLERRPGATLYPGDSEATAAAPNALDYAPVYYGWKG